MQKIPSPQEPKSKVPQKLPEQPSKKPSVFGERGYVRSSFFKKELKKGEYFSKLRLTKETREKIGEILGDRRIFGDLIEERELNKVQSLINELKIPGSSSYSEIREVAKKVREIIGNRKAKELGKIIEEKFGL
jgi:nitrogenase molybdenum-iron protein alpha/beta subunit